MDTIINKENRLGMQTPNAKKGLLKSVNKRPLADVLNVFEYERKSPGFDGCSKSPLKEKCDFDFEDLQYILKQSEFYAPAEAAKDMRSISLTFDNCVESLSEKLDDDTSDDSNDFLKYKELDEADDFHDIIPLDAWPTEDALKRMIRGICKSPIDRGNNHEYNVQLEQPDDNDYNILYDYAYMSSVAEVSFCSDIDFDMFSDDEIDE